MIVDSSAIVAIVFQEPGFATLLVKLAAANAVGIGAPTAAETAIVLVARLRRDCRGMVERFLQEFGIEVIPFAAEHWREAHDAYLRYGRGRHRAALNFGDCMTYATATLAKRPLLCVGDDFSKTDIELA